MPTRRTVMALAGASALAAGLNQFGGAALAQGAQGPLFMVGGNFRLDNEALWRRYVELAGGPGARIAIMPTAAANPTRSGDQVAAQLRKMGADPFVVPIAPRLKDVDPKKNAADPAIAEQVRAAGGVYFVGGNQDRITSSLLTEDGKDTAVLAAIRAVRTKGGVIGGSSAGAAIMSRDMFKDPPPILEVMKAGIVPGKTVDRGLDFMEAGWFVDQHFLVRGRFARTLVAMEALGYKKAVGVDENTAVIVRDGKLEVAGYKGALVIDLTDAKRDPAIKDFNLTGVRLTYLDRGDSYEMATAKLIPAPEKKDAINPSAADYKPYFTDKEFQGNILGNTAVVDLMANLIDNAQPEVIGLAYSAAPDVKEPEKGFAFRFYKDKDSIGYYTGAFGGEDYTVANIRLDVMPARIKVPVYELVR
ncbi:MAG TPA: cyanophycinase [Microvirga sp.]